MVNTVSIYLNVRRFDFDENPPDDFKRIELNKDLDYNSLKSEIQDLCDIKEDDDKVIKIRNKNLVLIAMSCLLEGSTETNPFIIDVAKINYKNRSSTTLLQDAYLSAVCRNLRTMESRVTQAELLLPQLQWRRQAHMEHTMNTLGSRVAFLNRRIDDLLPPQWKSKMPQTLA